MGRHMLVCVYDWYLCGGGGYLCGYNITCCMLCWNLPHPYMYVSISACVCVCGGGGGDTCVCVCSVHALVGDISHIAVDNMDVRVTCPRIVYASNAKGFIFQICYDGIACG